MTYSSRDMETYEISSYEIADIFVDFRLSEGYTDLRTPIANPFLRSFWGVNQLYTTGGSRDMENHTKMSL